MKKGLLFFAVAFAISAMQLQAANLEDSITTVTSDAGFLGGFPPANVIDNNDSSEWVSDLSVGVGGAAALTLEWAAPVTIYQVSIKHNVATPPASFQIETWDGAQYVAHDIIASQTAGGATTVHANGAMSESDFPAQTTRLRVNITAAHPANHPRFAEISVLDAPPPAPTRSEFYSLNPGSNSFNFHQLNQLKPFKDLNGDGIVDVVGVTAEGAAVFYQQLIDRQSYSENPQMLLTDGNASPNVVGFGILELGGDAKPDVAVFEGYAGPVTWDFYLSTAFDTPATVTAPTSSIAPKTGGLYSYWTLVADVNADGRQDLICDYHSADASNVRILYQLPDGTFDAATNLTVLAGDNNEGGIFAANVDGDPELEIVNSSLISITWWDNDGTWPTDGTPVARTGSYAINNSLTGNKQDVAIADINNDGTMDLIATGGTGITLWTNPAELWTATDNVVHTADISLGLTVFGCTVTDVNGDLLPDLIVGCGSSTILGFLNTGDAQIFDTADPDIFFGIDSFSSAGDVVIQDVTADGILDLIAYEEHAGNIAIYPNVLDATYVPAELSDFLME